MLDAVKKEKLINEFFPQSRAIAMRLLGDEVVSENLARALIVNNTKSILTDEEYNKLVIPWLNKWLDACEPSLEEERVAVETEMKQKIRATDDEYTKVYIEEELQKCLRIYDALSVHKNRLAERSAVSIF